VAREIEKKKRTQTNFERRSKTQGGLRAGEKFSHQISEVVGGHCKGVGPGGGVKKEPQKTHKCKGKRKREE